MSDMLSITGASGKMAVGLAPPYQPKFDFSSDAPSLLDQLDRFMQRELVQRHAATAYGYMGQILTRPAGEQEMFVQQVGLGRVSGINQRSDSSMTIAVAAAALSMAAREGSLLPAERIMLAMRLLDERYDASL